MTRVVYEKPWAGHNARVAADRARRRNIWFGWSRRDPAKYVKALPPLPLFYTPLAAARAASEAVAGSSGSGDGISSQLDGWPLQSQSKAATRPFGLDWSLAPFTVTSRPLKVA